MVASRLSVYNGALTELGERQISALTSNVESRRVLDQIWNNDFVDEILQMGQWNFAARTALLDYDTDVTSQFGFQRAFSKPSDWVRTMGVSENEHFEPPLSEYADEAGYIWCDVDEIYFKWVSNDTNYGNDFSKWPANFRRFAETYLARKAAPRLTQDEKKMEIIDRVATRALSIARSTDAMDDMHPRPPAGRWVRSRMGNMINRERRGS